MPKLSCPIVPLSAMNVDEEVDVFVRLTEKTQLTTRDGKPYLRVAFGDRHTTLRFPIWSDSPHFTDGRDRWHVGSYYKIRAVLQESPRFGNWLDIKRIRLATDQDRVDGFDPNLCKRSSIFEPDQVYDELLTLAQRNCTERNCVGGNGLARLVTEIFKEYRDKLLVASAARHFHHHFLGGLLEHTLSVTHLAIKMFDHYEMMYGDDKKGRISRPVLVAAAILHDIGKIEEMTPGDLATQRTTQGDLLGHIVLGRDIVRDHARAICLDRDTQLHLEHIILSHHRNAEWGSPKPPMSMEAAIVHHADSLDAMIGTFENILENDDSTGDITSHKTLYGHQIYRVNARGVRLKRPSE